MERRRRRDEDQGIRGNRSRNDRAGGTRYYTQEARTSRRGDNYSRHPAASDSGGVRIHERRAVDQRGQRAQETYNNPGEHLGGGYMMGQRMPLHEANHPRFSIRMHQAPSEDQPLYFPAYPDSHSGGQEAARYNYNPAGGGAREASPTERRRGAREASPTERRRGAREASPPERRRGGHERLAHDERRRKRYSGDRTDQQLPSGHRRERSPVQYPYESPSHEYVQEPFQYHRGSERPAEGRRHRIPYAQDEPLVELLSIRPSITKDHYPFKPSGANINTSAWTAPRITPRSSQGSGEYDRGDFHGSRNNMARSISPKGLRRDATAPRRSTGRGSQPTWRRRLSPVASQTPPVLSPDQSHSRRYRTAQSPPRYTPQYEARHSIMGHNPTDLPARNTLGLPMGIGQHEISQHMMSRPSMVSNRTTITNYIETDVETSYVPPFAVWPANIAIMKSLREQEDVTGEANNGERRSILLV